MKASPIQILKNTFYKPTIIKFSLNEKNVVGGGVVIQYQLDHGLIARLKANLKVKANFHLPPNTQGTIIVPNKVTGIRTVSLISRSLFLKTSATKNVIVEKGPPVHKPFHTIPILIDTKPSRVLTKPKEQDE